MLLQTDKENLLICIKNSLRKQGVKLLLYVNVFSNSIYIIGFLKTPGGVTWLNKS